MTEPNDDVDLDDDETAEEESKEEPTFAEVHERAAFAVGAREGRGAAEDFAVTYTKPADLLEPGASEDIARVREVSPQTADALERFRDEAKVEEDAGKTAAAESERERRKLELKSQREQQRRDVEEKERQSRLDRELLAELEEQDSAVAKSDGGGESIEIDFGAMTREEKLGALDLADAYNAAGPDERARLWDEYSQTDRAILLAQGFPGPLQPDRDAIAAVVEARLARLKEE
jgi:hypothetical protein